MTTRALPVLDIAPPVTGPAGPRDPLAPADERLGEFRPEVRSLPSFFVWTLGCQMNKSDSEEMAGRLLAAGCAEAPAMDVADLVVINTCAIREAAEAKVIGRQGAAPPKAANPGLRVVMTGCSVRESDRAGLPRRYPAVDVLGPTRSRSSSTAGHRLGPGACRGDRRDDGGARRAGLDATHRVRARASAIDDGAVSRGSAISAWLPIIYGLRQTCTTASSCSAADRAEPALRRDRRRRAPSPPPAGGGHAARPERQLRPRPRARGAVWHAHGAHRAAAIARAGPTSPS